MSKHTDPKKLCEWLREYSSGSYGDSALAADVIESLERQNAELLEALELAADRMERENMSVPCLVSKAIAKAKGAK